MWLLVCGADGGLKHCWYVRLQDITSQNNKVLMLIYVTTSDLFCGILFQFGFDMVLKNNTYYVVNQKSISWKELKFVKKKI
jgi:hypothetical protein